MPTVISQAPFTAPSSAPRAEPYNVLLHGERRKNDRRSVARRPGREQGMALEVLGHAVEYLIDSRMFLTQAPYTKAEQHAVQILMNASRCVFEECAIVVPLRTRAAEWVQRTFTRRKDDRVV